MITTLKCNICGRPRGFWWPVCEECLRTNHPQLQGEQRGGTATQRYSVKYDFWYRIKEVDK